MYELPHEYWNKSRLKVWDHSFSTYAPFSGTLTFLTLWYVCVSGGKNISFSEKSLKSLELMASPYRATQNPTFNSCARKLWKSTVKHATETPVLFNFWIWYNILSMIVWEKDIFISNKTQTPCSLNFLLIFVFQ